MNCPFSVYDHLRYKIAFKIALFLCKFRRKIEIGKATIYGPDSKVEQIRSSAKRRKPPELNSVLKTTVQ